MADLTFMFAADKLSEDFLMEFENELFEDQDDSMFSTIGSFIGRKLNQFQVYFEVTVHAIKCLWFKHRLIYLGIFFKGSK